MNPIDDLRSRGIPYTQPLKPFFFLFLFVVFPCFSPSPRCNVSCSVGPCQWPGDEDPNRTDRGEVGCFQTGGYRGWQMGGGPMKHHRLWPNVRSLGLRKLTSFHILCYFWSFFAQASSGTPEVHKVRQDTKVVVQPILSKWMIIPLFLGEHVTSDLFTTVFQTASNF